MKTYFDCVPCFVHQALNAARMVTDKEDVQDLLLRRTLTLLSEMDMRQPPPLMGRDIHRLIRQTMASRDPYRAVKQQFNDLARAVYPEVKQKVAAAADPLEAALRMAIAGNIIDFGARQAVSPEDVRQTLEMSLTVPLWGDWEGFVQDLASARNILYLTDNTGEIVLDRLLVEAIGPDRMVIAVRGAPVINDATYEDAEYAGLTELTRVIDNGTDIPGTVLAHCSQAFVRYFKEADLIIAKGQGNYETLSDIDCRPPLYFLFQTKCQVAARDIGCETGRFVVARQGGRPS